jgi:hypothetical protein
MLTQSIDGKYIIKEWDICEYLENQNGEDGRDGLRT